MRILFFGDIVGDNGRLVVIKNIDALIEKYRIDFVIANGENVSGGKGLIQSHYMSLLAAGVDCVTLGNHYHSKSNIDNYIDDVDSLVRPINLLNYKKGEGSILYDFESGIKIRVTNILGSAFINESVDSPYLSMLDLLAEIEDDSIHIVDYHGEATGEKQCFAYEFDGKVSAVLGTHTHVQTKDYRILKNGTGYISDVGMCGAYNGVLGFEKESVIKKTLYGHQSKFELDPEDDSLISAVVLDIDDYTKKCIEIFPLYLVMKGEKHG